LESTQRQHRRFPVDWGVEIRAADWSEALRLATGNVSRGGLFVRCDQQSPEVGALVQITLQLPDEMVLHAEAVVVHTIPPERALEAGMAPGFGIRFHEKHAVDLTLLEGLAASHSAGPFAQAISDEDFISLPAMLQAVDGQRHPTSAHKLVAASTGEDAISIVDAPPDDEAIPEIPDEVDITDEVNETARPAGEASPGPGPTADSGTERIFGIDFGTTFTSIAVVEGNRVRVLQDAEGHHLLPSVVCYPESGTPLCGWPAKEKIATLPSTTFTSPKRLVGRLFRDPNLDSILGSSPVRYSEGPGGQILADVYGQTLALSQVCAEIFRRAATIGEQATGTRVERVVLSAPVGFGAERAAIKRAAELAGLQVVGMVDEPVAAAMAFGLGLQPGERVAVYDFGGGTFDFTLLGIKATGGFEILGEAGDPWLGGDDFDLAIANYAANQFWREHKLDLRERRVEWQRLLFLCERAKRKLATEQQHQLLARAIVLSLRGPIDLSVPLDRPLLSRLCGELVERSLAAVESCLAVSEVPRDAIDHLVLTGGTSRMPLVREQVAEFFQREVTLLHDPEVAIVSGNALYGRFLGLKKGRALIS
jgi:actin-like ATPase involved in cell morphogenesis